MTHEPPVPAEREKLIERIDRYIAEGSEVFEGEHYRPLSFNILTDVRTYLASLSTPPGHPTREEITKAIGEVDASFGYSFNMTRLVDGVATHTLTMDGYESVDFEDRDDGYRLIEERRNQLRADAILSLLRPATSGGDVGRMARALATEMVLIGKERGMTILAWDEAEEWEREAMCRCVRAAIRALGASA